MSEISQMPKKRKVLPALKPQKMDKVLNDEINKIIEATEEQNLAISKILKNEINVQLYKTEAV